MGTIPRTILNRLPEHWSETNNSLQREFIFKTFKEAVEFMSSCVNSIDFLNHHPEWINVYNKVNVTLRTHDAGNVVTSKDYELAKVLEEVYLEKFS